MDSDLVNFKINNVIFHLPSPFITQEEMLIWGYISNYKGGAPSFLEWSGYFFCVQTVAGKIVLSSDITGGYRVYYINVKGQLYFSGDYSYLLNVLKINKCPITVDEQQHEYWKKFGYTVGDSTLFKEIKKMAPATSIVISAQGQIESENIWLPNLKHTPNAHQHKSYSYRHIAENLVSLQASNPTSPFVLLYSGGVDSTFLGMMLKELSIPYIAIVMRYRPASYDNCLDYERARANIMKCGAKQVDYIEIDSRLCYEKYISGILDDLLFDRHVGVSFYRCMQHISEKYGTNSIVVCGQSADSVLSFGPSDFNLSSFIKRAILYGNNAIRFMLQPLIRRNLGKDYKIVLSNLDKEIAFCDHKKYIFALNEHIPYYRLLRNVVESQNKFFTSKHSRYMYLKLFTYIQGADNQVVVKSANAFGIKRIVMPFATASFICGTIKYKSVWRELFDPKYVIRDLLKDKYDFDSFFNQYRGKLSSESILALKEPHFDLSLRIMDSFNHRVNQIVN